MDGDEVGGTMPTCSESDGRGDERRSPLRPIMSDLVVGAPTEKPVSDQGCNTSTERSAIERRGPVFLPEDFADPSREKTDTDSCRVTLSGFAKGVKVEDVASLCAGAIETGAFLKGDQLVLFNAMYGTPEEAVAAVDALDGALIKGSPFKAKRWHGPNTCPLVSSDTLDVYNVPSEFLSKEKLDVVFKMGQVTEVCSTGYCQVKFPTLTELAKTIMDTSYHTLAGQNLKFANGV
ncbi:hypothetical protein HPB50_018420 [Hyalomma asiaticum]|uniref:Uncharacterized protein n=1 Tax=Hyalomma asiaticum TaxID=266040 RepID=A0ACB7TJI2_HYAAI|nr:hypothetical protein HPB50_018420 [Hyalomma asiaticum]